MLHIARVSRNGDSRCSWYELADADVQKLENRLIMKPSRQMPWIQTFSDKETTTS
jgi:hypothetical protein